MSNEVMGYAGILVLIAFLAFGLPVYLSLAMTGVLGLVATSNVEVAQATVVAMAYQWGTSWPMIVIPLFILMGEFGFHSGISRDLYECAHRFIGHLRGGLAMATVMACTAFGAMSASSLANSATMGIIALPEMERHKYDRGLASGAVAAGGTIGIMMPPSTGLIILGMITGQSIGTLFIAGIVPALLMMVAYMITIRIVVQMNPTLAPPASPCSWKDRFASLRAIGPVIAIIVVVIGGMNAGTFTATEAGAVGAFATFAFLLTRRRLSRETLKKALASTVQTSAMIFMLFIGASIFGTFIALTGLPMNLAQWLVGLPVSRYVILAAVLLFYIPIGCFMDLLSAWMITLPIIYPIIQTLGFDLIWFLILMQVVGELGMITPPVGLNVYVVQGVSGIPMPEIFRGVMPYFFADGVVLMLLALFPAITLTLPNLVK